MPEASGRLWLRIPKVWGHIEPWRPISDRQFLTFSMFFVHQIWPGSLKVWPGTLKVWPGSLKVWSSSLKVWPSSLKVWPSSLEVWPSSSNGASSNIPAATAQPRLPPYSAAGAIAAAGPDLKAAGPDLEAAGPDFEAAGPGPDFDAAGPDWGMSPKRVVAGTSGVRRGAPLRGNFFWVFTPDMLVVNSKQLP